MKIIFGVGVILICYWLYLKFRIDLANKKALQAAKRASKAEKSFASCKTC